MTVPLPVVGDTTWDDWGSFIHGMALGSVGAVKWNGSAWPARPAGGYALVIWVGGTTQPAGMAADDLWIHPV